METLQAYELGQKLPVLVVSEGTKAMCQTVGV